MKRIAVISLSVLLLTLAACGGRQPDTEDAPAPPALEAPVAAEQLSPPPQEEPAGARLARMVEEMTTEEKIGQLFFVRCAEPDMAEKIARYHLGGVLLFSRDYKDAGGEWLTREAFTGKLERYQAAADIPLFIGSDEEGGTVTRATRSPNLFPAKLPSPQDLYKAGGMTGLLTDTLQYNDQLRALGINVNFAPVADVSADPKDFIFDRAFGQDAAATADYVARVVDVMNAVGIGCVLKHFPGYGSNADTHTGVAIDERSMDSFRAADLLPFAAGVEAGAPFVLVSHNIVTCMDAERPASLSPAVHEVLRGELGFPGVVLTDDLAMDAVKAYAGNGDVAVLALLAGNDMVVTTDFEAQIPRVLAAVEDGTLDMDTLDGAVTRVLAAKLRLGLLGEEP